MKSVFSVGISNRLPKKSEKYYAVSTFDLFSGPECGSMIDLVKLLTLPLYLWSSQINRYAWWYLMIKLVDLLDTVFFVLRRKQNQITFLHIYHHMSVVALALLYVRFTFSEHVSILVFLNSFVHVFMYGYYFLASLGPEMQKRLWWKRYITAMQLIQFAIIFVVMAASLALNCQVNKTTSVITVFYVSYYLYLFGSFYKRTYTRSGAPTPSTDTAGVVVKDKQI